MQCKRYIHACTVRNASTQWDAIVLDLDLNQNVCFQQWNPVSHSHPHPQHIHTNSPSHTHKHTWGIGQYCVMCRAALEHCYHCYSVWRAESVGRAAGKLASRLHGKYYKYTVCVHISVCTCYGVSIHTSSHPELIQWMLWLLWALPSHPEHIQCCCGYWQWVINLIKYQIIVSKEASFSDQRSGSNSIRNFVCVESAPLLKGYGML